MKRISIIVLTLCLSAVSAFSQNTAPEGYRYVDSLVYTPVSSIDESLRGKDIYSAMPSNVTISQSAAIRDSLGRHIVRNASRQVSGFRVRIFFDNKRDSRSASEEVEKRFRSLYPGYSTYRSFSSPFFKVTVGDFRTRTEANVALDRIKNDFPSAFVVKEKFRYPALDPESFRTDTVRVLRAIQE